MSEKKVFDNTIESTLDSVSSGQEFSESLIIWLTDAMIGAIPPETPVSRIPDVTKGIRYRVKVHCEFEVLE